MPADLVDLLFKPIRVELKKPIDEVKDLRACVRVTGVAIGAQNELADLTCTAAEACVWMSPISLSKSSRKERPQRR